MCAIFFCRLYALDTFRTNQAIIKAFIKFIWKTFGKNDTKYTRYKNWSDGKIDIIFDGRCPTLEYLTYLQKVNLQDWLERPRL